MPTDHPTDAECLVEGLDQAARTYWPALLIEGIALILFGILALFPAYHFWNCDYPGLAVPFWWDCGFVGLRVGPYRVGIALVAVLSCSQCDRRRRAVVEAVERRNLTYRDIDRLLCVGRGCQTLVPPGALRASRELQRMDSCQRRG